MVTSLGLNPHPSVWALDSCPGKQLLLSRSHYTVLLTDFLKCLNGKVQIALFVRGRMLRKVLAPDRACVRLSLISIDSDAVSLKKCPLVFRAVLPLDTQ